MGMPLIISGIPQNSNDFYYAGEPPSEIDITTPPERPIVGKPFSPRCIVRNSPDLRQAVVMVQWIGPSGEVLNSSAVRGNASLPLNFDELSLSDAGRYTCRAMIFSPLLPGPRTIERELNLLPESDPGIIIWFYCIAMHAEICF